MLDDLKNLYLGLCILVENTFKLFFHIILSVYNFLLPLKNSIRGVVNPQEFYRILLLSISTGGTFQGSIDYLQSHTKDFISDPVIIVAIQAFCRHCHEKQLPVVFFIVLFSFDYIRRKYHGTPQ